MRHNKTILIVEDEADARNYFQMVVRWLGYPAEIAEDGEEALACLDANRAISLVLLDSPDAAPGRSRNSARDAQCRT